MILPTRPSRLPLIAAGLVVLTGLASFLILDLGGESLDPSELPVIQLGQVSAEPGSDQTGGPTSEQPAAEPSLPAVTPTDSVPAGGTPPGGSTPAMGTTTTTRPPSSESTSPSGPSSTASPPSSTGLPDDTTTHSTQRQTVTTGVRVEGGQGPGPGSGESSSTSTTGHAR